MYRLQCFALAVVASSSLLASTSSALAKQLPSLPPTFGGSSPAGDFINLIATDLLNNDLYRVDAFTGTVHFLTTLPNISGFVAGMDFHLDGNYYFITAAANSALYRMNAETYETTLVGGLGSFIFEGGFAVSFEGQAWAVGGGETAPYFLLAIDLATGAATTIGSLGNRDYNGLDLRSDGMLVGLENLTNSLYTIDPLTAAQTFLGSIPVEPGLAGGLVIRDNVGYYVTGGPNTVGTNELYQFDPFTGQTSLVGALTDAGQSPLGFSSLATLNPTFFSSYCTTSANSTGQPGIIQATGSSSVSAGNLRLHALQIPNQFGIFFHGANFTQVPFGCSFLCTTSDIRRSPVVQSSGNYVSFTYDNQDNAHSLSNYVGNVRYFQYWFRDPMNLGQCGFSFNLTDALFLTVVP